MKQVAFKLFAVTIFGAATLATNATHAHDNDHSFSIPTCKLKKSSITNKRKHYAFAENADKSHCAWISGSQYPTDAVIKARRACEKRSGEKCKVVITSK